MGILAENGDITYMIRIFCIVMIQVTTHNKLLSH